MNTIYQNLWVESKVIVEGNVQHLMVSVEMYQSIIQVSHLKETGNRKVNKIKCKQKEGNNKDRAKNQLKLKEEKQQIKIK